MHGNGRCGGRLEGHDVWCRRRAWWLAPVRGGGWVGARNQMWLSWAAINIQGLRGGCPAAANYDSLN